MRTHRPPRLLYGNVCFTETEANIIAHTKPAAPDNSSGDASAGG